LASKQRVLITGVSRFLGLLLAKRLENDPAIEAVIGVDLDEPPLKVDGLEFIRADIRSPLIAKVLDSSGADTLVHTNILSSPGRLGGRSQMKENNVIGTMQLLAAAQRSSSMKRVVVRSSTAIYGSAPNEPSIIAEDHALRHVNLTGYGKDCAEAETYTRDFGRRRSDVDLVILRTQNVVGPSIKSSIVDYLSLPVVPTAMGFDPRLQFLHESDAVEALYLALTKGERGIFNIASEGIVYLSKAIRMMGAVQLPLPLPIGLIAAQVIRNFGLVDFPADQLSLIQFGRVVDTRRAKEVLGFAPRFTTEECLLDRMHRDDAQQPERPVWERDLMEFEHKKSSPMKEGV
jgi:UDP-glucose 4-epimerase